ncbi:zinc-binding alcohol dehydrogenase family protein [Alloalcanivorax sp. C16-1]|uniref:quinone oxidoreductase family protein n=1 Tax=Alloalcanivorax sp. C16-1 TaxID=3390051 RepID=UPI0039709E22|nr:zinc-binding alcohol dehydrogenase family protein [Alcanivorax sp.]
MRALIFSATGSLGNLTLTERPTPQPAEGEVRVAIRAAGLNPSDVKNVLGRFPYTTTPRIPGRDFAGVIDAGPADMIGLEVWGSGKGPGFTLDGSHAEYLVVPVNGVSRKPAALSFAQAAVSGVPYLTALESLERCQVKAGTAVLIIGAGAVARAAAGLARALGARVILAARRSAQVEQFGDQGLRALTLPAANNLGDEVRALLGDAPEVILDTTGFWLPAAVETVAPFGRIAVIAAPTNGKVETPIINLYRRGGSIVGINSMLHELPASAAMLDRIGAFFENGAVPAPLEFQEVPFSRAIDAYHEIDAGSTRKRALIPD